MRVSKLALLLLAPTGAGCQMPEPPGELVGDYAISALLTENTCGSDALPLASTLSYRAELRRDGATGYWLIGAPPANQGVLTSAGRFTFAREERFMVSDEAQAVDPELAELDPLTLYGYDPFDPEGQAANGDEPCTLIVRESIEGSVLSEGRFDGDSGADVALEGTNTIAMSATRDSECHRVLISAGGPFEELPCAATYELSGELISAEE